MLVVALGILATSRAEAHDDPILTAKILCSALTAQDHQAVFGELDDSASIQFDRPVRGRQQAQAWVDEQFAHNLHCQVDEIQTVERSSAANTITWTATFSRDDWGGANRTLTERLVIVNARITEWTSTQGDATAAAPAGAQTASQSSGVRRVSETQAAAADGPFGVPPGLIAAGLVILGGVAYAVRQRRSTINGGASVRPGSER
jgi:hypothetical protein